MAVFGLFSGGKTKNKKAAAKRLTSKILKTKKSSKARSASGGKSKTCEFC